MRSYQEKLSEFIKISPNQSVEQLWNDLLEYGFDMQVDAIVNRSDVISVLQRFLTKELDRDEVLLWAENIEIHPDIFWKDPEGDDEDEVLSKVIHYLANAEMEHFTLDQESAQKFIDMLSFNAP